MEVTVVQFVQVKLVYIIICLHTATVTNDDDDVGLHE